MTDTNRQAERPPACVHCGRTEADSPLLQFRFRGVTEWICSSCLPVLIHQPDRLGPKLPGASSIPRAPHGKHR